MAVPPQFVAADKRECQESKEVSSHWLCEHTLLLAKSTGSRNSKKFLLIGCASIHCCLRRPLAAGTQKSFFSLVVPAYIVAGDKRQQQKLNKVSSNWLGHHTYIVASSKCQKLNEVSSQWLRQHQMFPVLSSSISGGVIAPH